jgi:predicted anti-sigma-YlaC factor YlaD
MAAARANRSPSRAPRSSRVNSSTGDDDTGGNRVGLRTDYPSMRCDQIREAISARLDGEEPGIAPAEIGTHVASCPGCRAFMEGTAALHRSVRLAAAPPVPDLTPQVLAAIGAETGDRDLGSRERGLRIALALLGLVQLGVAVPALLGSDGGVDIHSARHLGSFSIALAVGFLFAAWRPARVAGLLPVVAALVVCVVGTSLLDVIGGRTAAVGEANHGVEIAGLMAAWLLAHPGLPKRTGVVAA